MPSARAPPPSRPSGGRSPRARGSGRRAPEAPPAPPGSRRSRCRVGKAPAEPHRGCASAAPSAAGSPTRAAPARLHSDRGRAPSAGAPGPAPPPVWITRSGPAPWRTTRRRPSSSRASAKAATNASASAAKASARMRRAPLARERRQRVVHLVALAERQDAGRPRSWRIAPFGGPGRLRHPPRYAALPRPPSPKFGHSSGGALAAHGLQCEQDLSRRPGARRSPPAPRWRSPCGRSSPGPPCRRGSAGRCLRRGGRGRFNASQSVRTLRHARLTTSLACRSVEQAGQGAAHPPGVGPGAVRPRRSAPRRAWSGADSGAAPSSATPPCRPPRARAVPAARAPSRHRTCRSPGGRDGRCASRGTRPQPARSAPRPSAASSSSSRIASMKARTRPRTPSSIGSLHPAPRSGEGPCVVVVSSMAWSPRRRQPPFWVGSTTGDYANPKSPPHPRQHLEGREKGLSICLPASSGRHLESEPPSDGNPQRFNQIGFCSSRNVRFGRALPWRPGETVRPSQQGSSDLPPRRRGRVQTPARRSQAPLGGRPETPGVEGRPCLQRAEARSQDTAGATTSGDAPARLEPRDALAHGAEIGAQANPGQTGRGDRKPRSVRARSRFVRGMEGPADANGRNRAANGTRR